MKKLTFILLIIFTLALSVCKDAGDIEGTNIGEKGPGNGIIFFDQGGQMMECSGELGNAKWENAITIASGFRGGGLTDWRLPTNAESDLIYKNLKLNRLGGFSNNWYWTSEGAASSWSSFITAYARNFKNGKLDSRDVESSYNVRAVRKYTKQETLPTNNTTLRISNQSFTEITDVIWNNVTFSNNEFENSIKSGTNVVRTVQPGGGYIFFKRNNNPIIARTRELIIIENNKPVEFIFLDNTVIVELRNDNNIGTLRDIQSTVVWWDDAEGDILPYTQRRLTDYSDISPKNGSKCIFLNGNEGDTADLAFNIQLEKNAKISFWHRFEPKNAQTASLKINNEEIRTWTVSSEWVFFENQINAGNTTIQFLSNDSLYLDDLLVFYTE